MLFNCSTLCDVIKSLLMAVLTCVIADFCSCEKKMNDACLTRSVPESGRITSVSYHWNFRCWISPGAIAVPRGRPSFWQTDHSKRSAFSRARARNYIGECYWLLQFIDLQLTLTQAYDGHGSSWIFFFSAHSSLPNFNWMRDYITVAHFSAERFRIEWWRGNS